MTSRFEAEKLWQQGYKGAKVKVGVFDTGIRADHPHVKNIRSALLQASYFRVEGSAVGVRVSPNAVSAWYSISCVVHSTR